MANNLRDTVDGINEKGWERAMRSAPTNEPQTYGDLKRLLSASPEGDWPSRVNPGMTHTQALKILRDGLATHPDDQRLDSTRRGFLYARNVMRECRTR